VRLSSGEIYNSFTVVGYEDRKDIAIVKARGCVGTAAYQVRW